MLYSDVWHGSLLVKLIIYNVVMKSIGNFKLLIFFYYLHSAITLFYYLPSEPKLNDEFTSHLH